MFLLASAWGMGGTIRATFNLAGYLAARGFDVEIVSVGRHRDVPFFAPLPAGVRLVALDDRRPAALEARRPVIRRLMRDVPSLLMHAHDRNYEAWSLWTDVRLARRLRGRAGYLIGTRPGLNLIAANLALPGFVTIGQEHMHFKHHHPALRRSMRRRYGRLDALTVLTEGDRAIYEDRARGDLRVIRIPNAVRDMGPARADPAARVVLAAGRLSPQKGFDLLIRAWAQVAPEHPEWRLRICGEGPLQERLAARIAAASLEGSATLAGPARDLGAEMERASIFVLSSRFEGFPLILLEAMSKAMAVASFDCPTGPADLIDDHRNGLLVPPKRVARLAAALRELMADEGLRRRCGEAAVETAREYGMDAIGARWEALLADLRRPDWPRR